MPKISHVFVGAWYLSQGLIRGAMKAGEYFNSTAPKIIDSIPSADQPKDIPQPLSKTMEIAQTTTSSAVKVTGYVGKNFIYCVLNMNKCFNSNENILIF